MCIQSTSSIIWYCGQGAAIPCSWEGNCRSGVALAMHHRLQGLFPLWGSRPRQGDEHPAYALLRSMAHLPLPADICQRSEWASFVETQSSSSDCVCVSQVRSCELCVGSAPGVAAGSQSPADEPYRCDRWHVVHLRDGRLLLHLPGETMSCMSWLIDWLTDWVPCYRWNSRLLVHLPGETMRLVAPVLIDWLATGETAGYLCICQVRQRDSLHLCWLIDWSTCCGWNSRLLVYLPGDSLHEYNARPVAALYC